MDVRGYGETSRAQETQPNSQIGLQQTDKPAQSKGDSEAASDRLREKSFASHKSEEELKRRICKELQNKTKHKNPTAKVTGLKTDSRPGHLPRETQHKKNIHE